MIENTDTLKNDRNDSVILFVMLYLTFPIVAVIILGLGFFLAAIYPTNAVTIVVCKPGYIAIQPLYGNKACVQGYYIDEHNQVPN